MRHLKIYEDFDDEFEIGEYVIGVNYTTFKILDKDVDKIIKQITKEDLEQFISSNKFNI